MADAMQCKALGYTYVYNIVNWPLGYELSLCLQTIFSNNLRFQEQAIL